MGETVVQVVYRIFKNIVVSFLFGTYFIEIFLNEVFYAEGMIVKYSSQLVPVLIVKHLAAD